MRGHTLTDRQNDALKAIRGHIKRKSVPPSRAELAKTLGLKNQSGVDQILHALVKKGWVRIHTGIERGIELLREGPPLVDIQKYPEVAAGNPNVPEDYPEPERLRDHESLSKLFKSKPDYFLKVRGDSMDRTGIRSGDVVAMRETDEARDGDIVVARIGNEITLKRFYKKDDDTVELRPESHNPEHQPISIDLRTDDFGIAGTVVGAIVASIGESKKGAGESAIPQTACRITPREVRFPK